MSALAYSAWINNSHGSVYAKTGAKGSLPKGTSVSVKAVSGSWAIISYKGAYGITKLKYLTSKSAKTGYITKNTPLYKSASSSGRKYGTLPRGTKVGVVGINGSYYQVTNSSGSVYGYVAKKYVSRTKPAVASTKSSSSGASSSSSRSVKPKSSSKADRAIAIAESLLGKPYSAHANPPHSFDCSRFVRYCYGKVGVSLKGSAQQQGYDSSFTKISYSNLKRGDIVCFNTNPNDGDLSDHTGIYLGGGKFIHASSSAGKVQYNYLDSGYYNDCFSWGLRK